MKTYFAMHGITKRNLDDSTPEYNKKLTDLGYDEAPLPDSEIPSKIEIAQGQIDERLIEKGRKQAESLAKQIIDFDLPITKIYCANQLRCILTAIIIADKLGLPLEIENVDIRLDARSYGEIAEKGMETKLLKEFYKNLDKLGFGGAKAILCYLFAPKKIRVEKKSDFNKRVHSFFDDKKADLENALIIAGSDVWSLNKKDNIFYLHKDEEKGLKRGQLAFIDFDREKEPRKKSQESVKEQ